MPGFPRECGVPDLFQILETRRGDFGMTRDNAMELGVPPARGANVRLEIDVEANQSQPAEP